MTREELQRLHGNIDELYGEYTRAETERIRLRATNETLRGMNEALRAEKESLMSEKNLLQADNESLQSEKERLQADNESLRKKIAERPEPSPQKAQTAQPQNIPVLYPAQEFIIETEYADNTGGPDEAGFWNRYIHAHGAMGVNDRYNFYIGYLYEHMQSARTNLSRNYRGRKGREPQRRVYPHRKGGTLQDVQPKV